eukprot:13091667-Heterocapsa_arctica.AAC.1
MSTKVSPSSAITSSFAGAVFSLNSKSPPATISRIWVLAASLALQRFNLCHLHGSLPCTKKT